MPRIRTTVAFSAAALALLGCTQDEPHTNLLLITVDTLRADHLGAYGHEAPTSPAIDQLFASAVVFDDAHSTSSWTLPSLASLLTSHYSSTHGCWQFYSKLDPSFPTLTEVLADAGYHTGAVVSHCFLSPVYGLAQGFADYDASLVRATFERSHMAITSAPITERALAFLDERAAAGSEQPWFLWIHYFDPHRAYQAHAGITEQFGEDDQALYAGEIRYTDDHVGQVLDRLAELGLADNTVVAFVSDHGEEFHDHGRTGHGKTLYREVERVPFAIRGPGVAPRRIDAPVSVIDFMPTMLGILGVAEPQTPMAGRDLSAALHGEDVPPAGILMESRLSLRNVNITAYVDGPWKLIVERPKSEGDGPEPPPNLTELMPETVHRMLFDRRVDPDERHDLAAAHPEVVARLREEMAAAVARAVEIGTHFEPAIGIALTAEEVEQLRELGYVGDQDEDDPSTDR